MSDIIQLLPDSVANQIAAGEVVQRPASAVKELMENAIDAGSTQIDVFIKDSGKSLIQVIDNGCGMSTTDARMSFERHATSKIRSAEDLFSIRTMGFRGEALASIAAVAQVELKTKRHDDSIGTSLFIEASEVTAQEPVSTASGTSFAIKNLFYNIPARRNFLKSNPVEARHVIDEFERVALAHPEVGMSLQLNGTEQFRLLIGNHRQRIVGIYGTNYNERLVPVQEDTNILRLHGFIGKPEFARKSRGEQFFFVNGRYIRDNYLNHAVVNAFEALLPSDSYPSYWIFLDIDPSRIDVNIHPTKTEIKFEDERSVYAIVRAAVKRSLGQYSVAPSLDFERETSFDLPSQDRYKPVVKPGVTINTQFNPFSREERRSNVSGWERLYEDVKQPLGFDCPAGTEQAILPLETDLTSPVAELYCFQLSNSTIACNYGGTGILLVDQQSAHERILFEKLMGRTQETAASQHTLFPTNLSFNAGDTAVLTEILPQLRQLGFDLQEFGGNTFVLQASPVNLEKGSEQETIERLIEDYRHSQDTTGDLLSRTARAIAKATAIRRGRKLEQAEMNRIVRDLMACSEPSLGIDGKACSSMLTNDEILSRMRRNS